MSRTQRIGVVMMLFGLHWLIAAPHSEFCGTLWLFSVAWMVLGAGMVIA